MDSSVACLKTSTTFIGDLFREVWYPYEGTSSDKQSSCSHNISPISSPKKGRHANPDTLAFQHVL